MGATIAFSLQKGSYWFPALQIIVLLHNLVYMDVGAAQHLPVYLNVPGLMMNAEDVDDLLRPAARASRASESMVTLRQIVLAEAECLGDLNSLDLFATLVLLFLARYLEWAPTPSPNWTGVSPIAHTSVVSTASAPTNSRRGACWRHSWLRRAPRAFAA